MILQVELYWICYALAKELELENPDMNTVRVLSDYQSKNAKKFHGITEDMLLYSQRLQSATPWLDPAHNSLATSLGDYALMLFTVVEMLQPIVERASLLSYVCFDTSLNAKCHELSNGLHRIIKVLSKLGWGNPLNCTLISDVNHLYVNDASFENWLLYPESAWGCYNTGDNTWLLCKIEDTTASSKCSVVHPFDAISKMKVPNYFWWACLQESDEDKHQLTSSLVSNVLREAGLSSAYEDVAPPVDRWQPVLDRLPSGIWHPRYL